MRAVKRVFNDSHDTGASSWYPMLDGDKVVTFTNSTGLIRVQGSNDRLTATTIKNTYVNGNDVIICTDKYVYYRIYISSNEGSITCDLDGVDSSYIVLTSDDSLPNTSTIIADGRAVYDAATTSSSSTVTSATARFTQNDVGKMVVVRRTDGTKGVLRSTISTVNSATSITLAANASFTTSNNALCIGTDNGAALEALLAAYDHVKLPAGLILGQLSDTAVIRDGCVLEGAGSSLPEHNNYKFPSIGTTLVMAPPFGTTGTIDVGETATFGSGVGGSKLKNLNLDSFWYTNYAVRMIGWDSEVDGCTIAHGTGSVVIMSGQGATLKNNHTIGLLGTSHNIVANGSDLVIDGNLIYHCSQTANTAMIAVTTGGGGRIHNNHTFGSESYSCQQIRFLAASVSLRNWIINNNVVEVGNNHQIALVTTGTGVISGINISNNKAYHNTGLTDATYDFVNANAASGGEISGISITGNAGRTLDAINWRSIFGDDGAVAATGVVVTGNVFSGCAAVEGGTAAAFYATGNAVSDDGTRTTFSAT